MALVRWAQGRLYSLSDALLDCAERPIQSVRQIRQHLNPCPATQAAGLLVCLLPIPHQPLDTLQTRDLAMPILIERMSA